MADQVEVQAAPVTLTRREVICWPKHDCKTKGDHTIPDAVFTSWAVHDIIRVYGL
jgi:hypothetical protein